MKSINNILLTVSALLALTPATLAQDWSINGQIKDPKAPYGPLSWPKASDNPLVVSSDFAYRKDISAPQSDGTYWIKLESFSTGMASYVTGSAPADIVLVLDVSSSMSSSRGNVTDYFVDPTPSNSTSSVYSYDGHGGSTSVYYYYADDYRQVSRYRSDRIGGTRYYCFTFTVGAKTYYLLGDQIYESWDAVPKSSANDSTTDELWTGTPFYRYRRAQRIDALREAVKTFIEVIDHNDQYDDDGNLRTNAAGQPDRLGNRISIVTYADAGYVDVQNSLEFELDDNTAAQLKADVDKYRLHGGTRTALGIAAANNQFALYVDDARRSVSSRTVVVFTDGSPNGETRDDGVAQALISKKKDDPATTAVEGYDATVFTVGMFSTTPTETGSNASTWRYMNYMSSNAPNATTNDNAGEGFNKNAGYYKDASDEEMDLSKLFSDIAHQSGGSSTSLGLASPNVDVISNSFILPAGADENIGNYVKIFVAKLNRIEGGEYVFDTEYLKGHLPDDYTYYALDSNNERVGDPIKVDRYINVALDPNDSKKIKVTGFDYKSNFCGPVYKEGYTPDGTAEDLNPEHIQSYQGYKIMILIPIKMNPDAVGGPNCETNGAGSGIYVNDGDQTAVVSFKSPTVSLPVNIFIKKTGLQGGESAKFRIERAILPEGDNVDASSLTDWTYVSTVFVTKSKGSTTDPVVKVKGLPANTEVEKTQIVDGVETVIYEEVDGEQRPVTERKNVVYRITEEGWSWSYTGPNGTTNPAKYTNTRNINNPFTFDNEKRYNIEHIVRHAESKATNIFKPGVVEGNVRYDDSKTNVRNSGNGGSGTGNEGNTGSGQ